jgi:hypothetical protein
MKKLVSATITAILVSCTGELPPRREETLVAWQATKQGLSNQLLGTDCTQTGEKGCRSGLCLHIQADPREVRVHGGSTRLAGCDLS